LKPNWFVKLCLLTSVVFTLVNSGVAQVTAVPENWREDLRVISTSLPALHANLFFQTPSSAFTAAVSSLDQQIPQLSDAQITVKLAELVAMVGDAHTNLTLTQAATNFRTFPLRLQWFDDGLFVIASLPGAERSIGKRVVSIDGMDIEDAHRRVVPAISAENDQWRRNLSEDYLAIPEVLKAEDVIGSPDRATFTFAEAGGAVFSLELQAVRATDARAWIYAPDLTIEPVPLYRKQNNQNYWFQYLSDSRTLYFKYNVCSEAPFLSFATFTIEVLKIVDTQAVDRFVIDLRNNTGGNSALIDPLINALYARYISGALSPNVRLSVIIGRETFSSALLNALDLKTAPMAVLVGEPTGGKPNHYGNVSTLTLPRSGLRVSYSTRFFSSPITTPSLQPDIRVPVLSSAFFQNRDPFLDAALENQSRKTDALPFVVYSGGGSRAQSTGADPALTVGYATLSGSGDLPAGLGVLRYRQQGVTISEATVLPTKPVMSGITYAEVDGRVDTGIAIANTSQQEAIIAFQITTESGQSVSSGELRVAAGGQISRFLSESPFNVRNLTAGALRLSSSAPVALIGLRGYSNERNEFLLSTLAFAEPTNSTSPVYCAHFADGDGWTTQINLVNASDQTISGNIEFVPGQRIAYSLLPRSARRFRTAGTGAIRTGFVAVIPDSGSIAPTATSLFSFRRNGITVSEASVHGLPTGATHTIVVSGSGGFLTSSANAVMSGIGVANPDTDEATVQFTLVSLAGSTLVSRSIQIPGKSQQAFFINELFAGTVTLPFDGTLRVTSSKGIVVTGLRGQYNERGDFLISATPAMGDIPGTVFPHIVEGGGYSMRFVFISRPGSTGGFLRLSGTSGGKISLELRD